MAVYVDDVFIPKRLGRFEAKWCHMTADTDEELHAFAEQLGLKREWFQPNARRPEANHYDVTMTVRREAVKLGAVEEPWRDGAVRRRARGELRRLQRQETS